MILFLQTATPASFLVSLNKLVGYPHSSLREWFFLPLFTLVSLIAFNFLCLIHSFFHSFIQIGSQSAV